MAVNGAKPSVSEAAIRYQARTTLATLATEIADLRKHKSEKALEKIKEAKQIRLWLKALDYKAYLTRAQREKIWYALIDIANVNDFPTSPLLEERTVPNILIGGGTTTNNTVIQSESAGNISFSNSDVDTGTEAVDSFPSSLSKGAEWKIVARKNDGTGSFTTEVQAVWNTDGSSIAVDQDGGSAIGAVTTDNALFTVVYNSGDIELRATVDSDNWTIEGSRQHIPPVNNTEVNINLPQAQIYVGNSVGIATAVAVSGDISITDAGVVSVDSLSETIVLPETVVNQIISEINDNSSTTINQSNITNLTTALSNRLTDVFVQDTWNMDTSASKTISHGQVFANIKDIHVHIIRNGGTLKYKLNSVLQAGGSLGGGFYWDSTNIYLERTDSGFFNSSAFNAAEAIVHLEMVA